MNKTNSKITQLKSEMEMIWDKISEDDEFQSGDDHSDEEQDDDDEDEQSDILNFPTILFSIFTGGIGFAIGKLY